MRDYFVRSVLLALCAGVILSACSQTNLDVSVSTMTASVSETSEVSQQEKSGMGFGSTTSETSRTENRGSDYLSTLSKVVNSEGHFYYDPDSRLTAFWAGPETTHSATEVGPEEKELTQEERQEIAEAYLQDKVPIATYSLWSQETINHVTYFSWYRIRNGYATSEIAQCEVAYDGTILNYNSLNVNRFADRELPVINEQVLASQLDEQVRRTLGEVSYEEDPEKRMWILMEDDTVGMAMMVTYAIPDGDGETEEYEFHIPLE